MSRSRAGLVLLALVGLLAGLLLAGPFASPGAGEGSQASDRAGASTDRTALGGPEVGRVLVFSLPTVSWRDLDDFKAPHINALLDESAIAALSVRAVDRNTTSSDGYSTLNAGTRSRGTSSADLAFDVGEVYEGASAAEEFTRRTGVNPPQGSVFSFGIVGLIEANERLRYGAETGALGDALRAAEFDTAVIANGDHPEGRDAIRFRRAAAVGVIDSSGVDVGGTVGPGLLESNQDAPYETQLDNAAVAAAFEDQWADNSVVLVEASDFVRYEDFRSLATEQQRVKLKQDTLTRSDELLAMLLEQVDPERDAVVIVAPYHESAGVHLTVMGVRAPRLEPGLLSSGTTRRAGFVSLVDVAPTLLDLVGIEQPSSMEGTPMERDGAGGDSADRRSFLISANDGALFRDSLVGPASRNFVIAQIVLWVVALIAMATESRRLSLATEVGALCVLSFLPATFLAAPLPFHEWGSLAYWGFVVAISAAIGLLAALVGRRRLVDPLIVVLAAIVGLLAIDVVTGARLELNTVFGYTPTVAGRFAGLGNPAFAMFSASAIVLAALSAYRIGAGRNGTTPEGVRAGHIPDLTSPQARKGAWFGVALLAVAVVIDGAPFWGADVGGVLSFVPAAGLTAWMLLGYRVRIRTVAVWCLAAAFAVAIFGTLDLQRPPEERSHLGRLFEDVGANGYSAFETVVLRKLDANLGVLTRSVWTLMLPVVFAFVGYLFWRAPWRLVRIQEVIPQERAALAGLIVAATLGFALNDSGIAVPGMMLGVVNAGLVHLVLRVSRFAPDDPVEVRMATDDDPEAGEVHESVDAQGPRENVETVESIR